jgi:exopolysaccharide biosynthesis polyprenyl glycosylphosphotransferase
MAASFGVALVVAGQMVQPGDLGAFFAVRVKLQNFLFFLSFAAVWYLVFAFFGLYRDRNQTLLAMEWWTVVKASTVGALILAGLAFLFRFSAVNPAFLGTFLALSLGGTIAVRTVIRGLLAEARRTKRSLRNLVIVGCGPKGAEFGREVRSRPDLGYLLLGYIDDIEPPPNPQHRGNEKSLGSLSEAPRVLKSLEVDEVVISLPIKSFYDVIAQIIATCEEIGLTVRVSADLFDSHHAKVTMDVDHGQPMVTFGTRAQSAVSSGIKRVVDVVVSAVALALFSPLFAVVSLAIRLDSRGPIFFGQDRVGLGRRRFRMVKFRSMESDAEEHQAELDEANEVEGAAFKIAKDPRVTRVGRVLRKLSIDELPQLFNVLRGEMSLVGPRPLPIRDVERFTMEWQTRRFSVKPGLTCLWQVNGRHQIDFDNWMELDLEYIDNWSLSLDFDILLKTVPAVLRGAGAS